MRGRREAVVLRNIYWNRKQYVISVIYKRTLSTVQLYIKLPYVLVFRRQLSNSGMVTAVVAEGFHILSSLCVHVS